MDPDPKTPTYYGRAQLKPAPFENWVVGGYIFLAGLSGGAQILSTIADLSRREDSAGVVARGRLLAMLAPTLGTALLIHDLGDRRRFYNMARIFKRTSPMSIGTWVLAAFSASAGIGALAQLAPWRWPTRVAKVAQVPAALTGAALGTYTAALLAATSTPLWAASPRGLAMRFASSAIASGAAALSLGERSAGAARTLDQIALVALTAELAATMVSAEDYRRTGVADALDGGWDAVATLGGTLLPIGLHALSLSRGRKSALSTAASVAVLAGSLLMRTSIMAAGDASAADPRISFRFASNENS